jgi:anti-sigma regulatory factor (Ser/Thr protein kinase)
MHYKKVLSMRLAGPGEVTDSAGVAIDSEAAAYDVELRLPESHSGLTLAREFARRTLTDRRYRGRHDHVLLVVSELVTNAMLHGAAPAVLRLSGTPWRVRVEVADRSPVLPEPRVAGQDGGWGLHLVSRLAGHWEAVRRDGGKVVWCELAPAVAPTAAGTG